MNPQQYPGAQVPQPTEDPNNPYAFILQNGAPQPKSSFPLPTGKSPVQRALIFGGGFLLLLVVGLMLVSLVTGGGGRNSELISLAQEQTELVRIADLSRNERAVRNSATQNLASTTSLSITSSKLQTLSLISGKKPGDKTLALKQSSKTDALLTSAASNNEYDQVFTDTLKTKLKAYQATIKKLFISAKKEKEKSILQTAYDGTVILLGENN